MNWMIDGAHGDLYRQAMGYPQQQQAHDEWETERNLGNRRRGNRTAMVKRFLTATGDRMAAVLQQAASSLHQPERNVS